MAEPAPAGPARARRLRPSPSAAAGITGLVVALIQLAPVLGQGYVLLRDMVFVPRPPFTASLLGVTGTPRGVPSDLLVALLSRIVPGDVVEDLVLLAIIAGGAWGAGRVLRHNYPAAVAAAVLYGWNPYLTERLLLGQWAVLIGYAAAPWAVGAAISLRRNEPGAGRRIFLWLAVAAAGGASAEFLAALPVVVLLAWPGGARRLRRLASVVASLVIVALPWLVPALIQPALPPDRFGVEAFASRPDGPLGTVGSLLTLGGVWNAGAVPPGRGLWIVALVSLAMTAVAIWGLLRAARWLGREVTRAIAVAGALALLLALWGAVPGVQVLLGSLASRLEAVDLLRDGQRSLAPFVLAVALGWGVAVAELASRWRQAAALVATPLLLLPAAGWGIAGALVATRWPGDWATVAAASARLPPGPVLVLPWGSVRAFSWNDGRPFIDPADRWLPRRTVGDTRLAVGTLVTPQEDPLAREIGLAAAGSGPLLPGLQAHGYAGVLVERGLPGSSSDVRRLAGATPVEITPTLALYAVPRPVAAPPGSPPTLLVLIGDGMAGFAVLLMGVSSLVRRRKPCVSK